MTTSGSVPGRLVSGSKNMLRLRKRLNLSLTISLTWTSTKKMRKNSIMNRMQRELEPLED